MKHFATVHNQKGIAHILLLIILLIGIAVGLYLALNPTIFRPKANLDAENTNYIGLPLDRELRDGKVYIHGEPIYLKTAWLTIEFGPTGAYGYRVCNTTETGTPPKVKTVDPECMFFGRENPDEYLQYPKLLKERGYNAIRINPYWYMLDPKGEGRVTDEKAFEGMKKLLDATMEEGMYIGFQLMAYPIGGGGIPSVFFDKNPDAQAEGFATKDDGSPELSQKHLWTDCEYRTIDPALNQNTANKGWPDADCDTKTRVNGQGYAKVPSIHSEKYQQVTRAMIQDVIKKLGKKYAQSILWYETSVEPMYIHSAYIDYSNNAKVAFERYLATLPDEEKRKAENEGCLQEGRLIWDMDSQNRILCNDTLNQMINPDSTWNIFRGRALGDYIRMEAIAYEDGLKGVLKDLYSDDKIWIAADYLDVSVQETKKRLHDPKKEARTHGHRFKYLEKLKDKVDIIQINAGAAGNNSVDLYDIVRGVNPTWAISEHMTFEPGVWKHPDSYIRDELFKVSTNFGLEFFHPRPVNDIPETVFDENGNKQTTTRNFSAAEVMNITHPKSKITIQQMRAVYPSAYKNSWTLFDRNWNPKPSYLPWSQLLMTSAKSYPFEPKDIKDFLPGQLDTPVKPKLKNFTIGKSSDGRYYYSAQSVDNHLLGNYTIYGIRSDADKSKAENYVVLETQPINIYAEDAKRFVDIKTIDPSVPYDFIINTYDYKGIACEYGVDGKGFADGCAGDPSDPTAILKNVVLNNQTADVVCPQVEWDVPGRVETGMSFDGKIRLTGGKNAEYISVYQYTTDIANKLELVQVSGDTFSFKSRPNGSVSVRLLFIVNDWIGYNISAPGLSIPQRCSERVVPWVARLGSGMESSGIRVRENAVGTPGYEVEYGIEGSASKEKPFTITMKNLTAPGDWNYVAIIVGGKSYWLEGRDNGFAWRSGGLPAGRYSVQLVAHCDYSSPDPAGGSGPNCQNSDVRFPNATLTVAEFSIEPIN